jgi:heat shock protein HslJ
MRVNPWMSIAALAMCACAHTGNSKGPDMPPPSTAQLMNTYWKLTQLGEMQIVTPADAREIHLVLQADDSRAAGFSGCNRFTGGYVLDGDNLRFSQLAGTRMACVARMDTEKDFLAMLNAVARWQISGEMLQLLDADGHTLATFQSRYLK